MEHLISTVENFGSPQILLVGDLMLDEFVYGDADRISPESPVPVMRVVKTECRLGGAANVAMELATLGARVKIVGMIGKDRPGELILAELAKLGVDSSGILQVAGRPTICKRRYVGLAQHRHAQQMLRVDTESPEPVNREICLQIRQRIYDRLDGVQVLALEDYGKGLFCDQLSEVIEIVRGKGIHVIVDPHPTVDYKRYHGCSLLTPNRNEAEIASGVKITSEDTMNHAADEILRITHADGVVITLDKEGAFIKKRDGFAAKVPTRTRKVYDVTGAGDVVMAMLSMCMACDCELQRAIALSNVAGGLEVERFGVTPVTRQEIIAEIRNLMGIRREKILDRESLKQHLENRRSQGQTIVFTNGCFDLLHIGHMTYLHQAAELGDCLVVAINSDSSVQMLKGPSRPIVSQRERAQMLAALECVDYVTIFDEGTPESLIELFRPDILVKGGSTAYIVGQEFVESYGGMVKRLDLVKGFSTTDIVKKILELNGKEAERK